MDLSYDNLTLNSSANLLRNCGDFEWEIDSITANFSLDVILKNLIVEISLKQEFRQMLVKFLENLH